ncbi:ABC transporter family protein [Tritrichomonas foetus]|uniref:ABC transporter family protein n=1 Tax=Tritrichomonas foetus TaxID=1144522 RepID=A0A1J4JDV2_9EUKA|nr:ABC transporter family protein [Tritrichomonas foetus]|eukprot:OHS97374.1 ABC transporter family protein [Tritrichomonas foetus]
MGKVEMINFKQIKPLAHRRTLIFWRTKYVTIRVLMPLVFGLVIAVVMGFVLNQNEDLNPQPATFKDFVVKEKPLYAIVCNDTAFNSQFVQKFSNTISNLIKEDTSKTPEMIRFKSSTEFNKWVYDVQVIGNGTNLLIGVEISDNLNETSKTYPITVLYNNSMIESNPSLPVYFSQVQRALFRTFDLGNLNSRFVTLSQQTMDLMISSFIPFFMLLGFTGLLQIVATITTDDVKSQKRPFLITCGVKLPTYWISSILIDYVVWLICGLIAWIVFMSVGFALIRNNIVLTLWSIFLDGFSFLLFIYCIAFLFTDPETSGSLSVMIALILIIIAFVVDLVRGNKGNDIVNWVYSLFPPLNFYSMFSTAGRLYDGSASFGSLWSNKQTMPLLIFSLGNIPIWSFILFLIEYLRVKIPEMKTKKDYLNNKDIIQERRQRTTEEAQEACREAENNSLNDYAVRVLHVSRLFFNNEKKIIPAVNDVTFGIKKNSMFGFLGSNGAGKTTLMKMITNEIPVSSGNIEVNGPISICPQFNDHLTNEMTAMEHFKIFSQIFGLDSNNFGQNHGQSQNLEDFLQNIIEKLELGEHKDKIIKELSGGNARKVAVALSLLAPTDIVLFDEPTSSLDPMARHAVHELMNGYRGQKTFMLCTHLLDEAESLCDMISIMFHGSVYVVGTPQYLSSKFGTEWKVDILLDNDSEQVADNVTNFMNENLPTSRISIKRPTNRIYSIPANDIEIAQLFKLMKSGVEQNIGIKYFTCSSSTLEKVFLELIIQSEENEREEMAYDTTALL